MWRIQFTSLFILNLSKAFKALNSGQQPHSLFFLICFATPKLGIVHLATFVIKFTITTCRHPNPALPMPTVSQVLYRIKECHVTVTIAGAEDMGFQRELVRMTTAIAVK